MATNGKGGPPPVQISDRIQNFKMPKFQLSSKLTGAVSILVVIFVGFMIAYNMFFFYVEPNEFGIKIIKVGMNRGVQEKPYVTGLHWVTPGLQEMHRLPRDIQVLELTNNPQNASQFSTLEKAAHIQTSDGFFVNVDGSISAIPLCFLRQAEPLFNPFARKSQIFLINLTHSLSEIFFLAGIDNRLNVYFN